MKRKYTVEEKLAVVNEVENSSIRAVAKKHRLDRKTVRKWKNQKRELQFVNSVSYRLPGGGHFIVSEELEFTLLEMIETRRSSGGRVTRNMIVHWAASWVEEHAGTALQVSNSWLQCFSERNNLVLRRATSKPKLTQDAIVERGVNFIKHVQQLIKDYNIQYESIYNMDETAVFLDHNRNTTIETRGTEDVNVKPFGLDKNRVTAAFAASASGRKLKPAMMTKGSGASIETIEGVVMMRGGNSWITSEWFTKWVDYYFPMVQRNTVLLVADSARNHISKKAKAHLNARGILFCVIPGEMTPHLQPADYAWFKPLKDSIMASIDDWKLSGGFEYTRGGNVKAPREEVVRSWLTSAWDDLSCETIMTSFRRCFLGADEQLSLMKHSIYGEVFKTILATHRTVAASSTEASEESSSGSESDDGEAFIDTIAEADL